MENANDLLDRLASGEMRLMDASGAPVAWASADMPFSTTQDYKPTFYDGDVGFPAYGVDPNKTQDEADARDGNIVE